MQMSPFTILKKPRSSQMGQYNQEYYYIHWHLYCPCNLTLLSPANGFCNHEKIFTYRLLIVVNASQEHNVKVMSLVMHSCGSNSSQIKMVVISLQCATIEQY